jgi:hypothetical protein
LPSPLLCLCLCLCLAVFTRLPPTPSSPPSARRRSLPPPIRSSANSNTARRGAAQRCRPPPSLPRRIQRRSCRSPGACVLCFCFHRAWFRCGSLAGSMWLHGNWVLCLLARDEPAVVRCVGARRWVASSVGADAACDFACLSGWWSWWLLVHFRVGDPEPVASRLP